MRLQSNGGASAYESREHFLATAARQANVVELRFFGGLSVSETATVPGVSEATVARDWRMARRWLLSEFGAAD